jgi:BirA family transcriptional regulator, biotin operon repressor / biotin---[acetyl-CoA-carboxylase] ligase
MQRKGIEQRVKILKILTQSGSVSGQSIADSCNISRIAVWKHINYLKDNGVIINTHPNKGYSFVDFGNKLLPEVVRLKLSKSGLVNNVIYFDSVDSTNNVAKRLLEAGSLIVAEQQNRGRGRKGKEWKSQKYKDILFSLTISPDMPYHYLPIFNIIASLAIARALNRLFKIDAKTKWPNDVLVAGKKVSGVLVEFVAELDFIDKLIIGIGLDLNSNTKMPNASSISKILKESKLDRLEVLAAIIVELESLVKLVQNRDFGKIKSIWKRYSFDFKKKIKVVELERAVVGKSAGIDSYGDITISKGSKIITTRPVESIRIIK